MGQDWTYVNLDKGECLYVGKLGETIWNGEAETILKLLAVPVKPYTGVAGEDVPFWTQRDKADRASGSWAGDRIILLGEYAEEWPAGLCGSEDFERLWPRYDGLEGYGPSEFVGLCTDIRLGYSGYNEFPSSPGYNWVLRNISKKEFVRSNGLPSLTRDGCRFEYTGYGGLDGVRNLGLQFILPATLGWSTDPSCSMFWEYKNEGDSLAKGRWGGDVLDARLMNEHLGKEMEGNNWMDLSREQAVRMRAIYKSDFGEVELAEEPEMSPLP